jgi:hypothetical protein
VQIDPKIWYFNPETGEYHRIKETYKGQVTVEQATYRQRVLQEHAWKKDLRKNSILFVIFLVMSVFGYEEFFRGDWVSVPAFFALLLGPILALFTGRSIVGTALNLSKHTVGPPPVPPPGREQVEQQKVHGDGRVMTREEMDRALRGSAPSAQSQTFED